VRCDARLLDELRARRQASGGKCPRLAGLRVGRCLHALHRRAASGDPSHARHVSSQRGGGLQARGSRESAVELECWSRLTEAAEVGAVPVMRHGYAGAPAPARATGSARKVMHITARTALAVAILLGCAAVPAIATRAADR